MDLNEIDAEADNLLEKLASTESAAEVRDLCFRLDGFYRGAQVKALALSQPLPTCIAVDRLGIEKCVLHAGHSGRHESKGPGPLSWPNDDPFLESPSRSLTADLRDAIQGWRQFAQGIEDSGTTLGMDTSSAGCMATAGAYASQLESILEKHGIGQHGV